MYNLFDALNSNDKTLMQKLRTGEQKSKEQDLNAPSHKRTNNDLNL
jgi:hypothetical protein